MLLKEYNSPRLTLERIKVVIDRALEELEYNADFDSYVAAQAAECYLAHTGTMVVSANIVGGRDYAENEFINYTDAIGATPDAVAAVIKLAIFWRDESL